MSFDGMFTYALTTELTELLLNGRISRIYQPYKNELIFQIRANGKNHKLLLSAHPSYSRVHLTTHTYENPAEPPMFCMLLRKHLEGGIIESIYQPERERIVIFDIRSRNELGDLTQKKLIAEIMGRHSNIILIDTESGKILDSIKHISTSVNRHRTLLPGHLYIAPPDQNKTDPFLIDADDVLKKLDFNAGKLDKQLVNAFSGVSPLLASEAIHRARIANRQTLPKAFMELISEIRDHRFEPTITESDNKQSFYFINLKHLKGEKKSFSSCSELLDRFYFGKAERDRVKQLASDLEKYLINEIKKNEKKLDKLAKTLKDADKADSYQLYGELLTANLYRMKRGDKEVEVDNYYDETEGTIIISLNPQKTPSENAQSYFIKYQKAKKSVSIVTEQIDNTNDEIAYLETLLQQLQSASPKDIEEIREELADEGYIKAKKGRQTNKQQAKKHPVLEEYTASDETTILVGKNNKQNEYLTNRLAAKTDLWFHTKDIPGSHVVIRSSNPTEQTIKEAAILAAYFSKAKQSSSVPVDYTMIKHVKKPSGAKPGYVIYDNQQTIYVTPNEDIVVALKKQ
ncbi:fibronectin/fibrinogen-binding protein [Bacillus sp. HMF5848]|uniref:Rqc2 family fibronectin-binding protein n=1 Tax=Bacillus sp. HMF5848 TaxID=2495421 RepID=UPI000F77DF1F|nr:NFACT RNA binding domain-containing protein [Bacillus sp. HMF5848]RSK26971.1 fibronectin/fibrinogen-binding protein [Bacillus sp. HMF5848]